MVKAGMILEASNELVNIWKFPFYVSREKLKIQS